MTDTQREAFEDGRWYWVRYEGLGQTYDAPALYRANAQAFYSHQFSGVPAREVIVLSALTQPQAQQEPRSDACGGGLSYKGSRLVCIESCRNVQPLSKLADALRFTPGVVYVCPEKDYECGDHSVGWCKSCPKRGGVAQQAAAVPAGFIDLFKVASEWTKQHPEKEIGDIADLLGALTGHINAMLSSAPAAPQAQGWLPIESAPKDGTNVLLVNRAGNIAAGLWLDSLSGSGWYLRGGCGGPDAFFNTHYGPTHYMPLPAPPVGIAGGEGG